MIIKTDKELEVLRYLGKLHKNIFEEIKKLATPGVSTGDINEFVGNMCKTYNVLPGFYGVYGFPANICISINQCVVHGVPTKKMIFQKGDVVKFDFGLKDKVLGLNTDAAFTMVIGGTDDEKLKKFLKVNEEALYKGIAKAIPGNRTGDIGHAIQSHVESNGFFIVKDLTGHGIGYKLHEKPYVYNYGKPKTGEMLVANMLLAIEPIIGYTTGKIKSYTNKFDIDIANGSYGSQFEHTIIVREGYPEIIV